MNVKFKIFILNLVLVLFMGNISYATEGADFSIAGAILKLLFTTMIFIVVIIITIYGTRFIAKKSNRFISSKYIRVIDSLNLGTNIKIVMVEINNFVYILVTNNNTIEIVDKIVREEFEFNQNKDSEKELYRYMDRYDYISKFQGKMNKILNKSSKFVDKEEEDNEKKF